MVAAVLSQEICNKNGGKVGQGHICVGDATQAKWYQEIDLNKYGYRKINSIYSIT